MRCVGETNVKYHFFEMKRDIGMANQRKQAVAYPISFVS